MWTGVTDGSQLAFVSTSRDHKDEKFRIADAATGAVREVFEEKVATQYEFGRGQRSIGGFCPSPMRSSGIRSGTTGGISICMMRRPGR